MSASRAVPNALHARLRRAPAPRRRPKRRTNPRSPADLRPDSSRNSPARGPGVGGSLRHATRPLVLRAGQARPSGPRPGKCSCASYTTSYTARQEQDPPRGQSGRVATVGRWTGMTGRCAGWCASPEGKLRKVSRPAISGRDAQSPQSLWVRAAGRRGMGTRNGAKLDRDLMMTWAAVMSSGTRTGDKTNAKMANRATRVMVLHLSCEGVLAGISLSGRLAGRVRDSPVA